MAPTLNTHDQHHADRFSIFNGDCLEVMPTLPDQSVHLSVYSPPFAGLYHYSSSDRDLSNARTYDEFMEHYGLVVAELHRLTLPGRVSAVHVMDIPTGNTGKDALMDFPGDVIRLHQRLGWDFIGRRAIWKEPLAVRNRTMVKNLAHKTIVEDSAYASVASADYLLAFRKRGTNTLPIGHPNGLTEYAGSNKVPAELESWRGWTGSQIENRYSHWIWRQYASSIWDDVRGNMGDRTLDAGGTLAYREAREEDDEKHLHPLQLDVIARCVQLWSNPDEVVLTPFLGVGSEVYEAVRLGRRGLGVELKTSYYRQALANLEALAEIEAAGRPAEPDSLFDVDWGAGS